MNHQRKLATLASGFDDNLVNKIIIWDYGVRDAQ